MTTRLARGILLALAAVLWTARQSSACILEFRSLDWQVAESPLVLVGKVVEVTPEPIPPEIAGVFRNGITKPAVATVAVERVLKGPGELKTVKISSGPVRSCSPFPVHMAFTAGETYVFIASDHEGLDYSLGWSGSVLKATEVAKVVGSLERCKTWRGEYLDRVKSESPKVFEAASRLDVALAAASTRWPSAGELTPAELLHGVSEDGPMKGAADAAFGLVKSLEPAVVEAALAMDFGRAAPWSRHPVWQQVETRYSEEHAKDLMAIQHAEWSRLLKIAGASAEQVDHYFARIEQDNPGASLAFPIQLPTLVTRLRGENLTTDFMLRSQAFDRGELYFAYGLDLSTLAGLDAQRLQKIVPALCRNSDEHLRLAGDAAMAQMPGEDFADLMAERIVAGEKELLGCIQASAASESHFKAAIDYAGKHLGTKERTQLWKALAEAACFTPACVEGAKAAAIETGNLPAAGMAEYRAALQNYLESAAAYEKTAKSLFPPG